MQKKPPRRRNGPPQPGTGRSQSTPPTDKPGIKNPYLRYRPLRKPQVALHPTTLWDYPSQHYGENEQGKQGYRGATPSHIIWNCIERYTKEGDLVVDPFVGSGTTLDVCRDLKRRGKGFDLAPTRVDIVRGDARELSSLVERESAHLVFFDPPYADNLKYSDDPACIGKLPWAGGRWSEAMGRVLDEIMVITKPGGYVCGFVSDVLHVEHQSEKQGGREHKTVRRDFQPLGIALWNLALERGFIGVDHVAVVRRGKALDDPRLRARAEQDQFMLRGFSHLVIFQRPMVAPTKKKAAKPAFEPKQAPQPPPPPKKPEFPKGRPEGKEFKTYGRPRDDDRGGPPTRRGPSKRPSKASPRR